MEQLIIAIKQEQNKRAYKLKKVINQNTITIKVMTSLVNKYRKKNYDNKDQIIKTPKDILKNPDLKETINLINTTNISNNRAKSLLTPTTNNKEDYTINYISDNIGTETIQTHKQNVHQN